MPTELIVVLDVDTRDEALSVVERCSGCEWFKVGFQLFTRCGPDVVHALREREKKVMLDLKFHDIPNTVHQAARSAVDMGVDFFTLHAGGGRDMIQAAREGVEGSATRILAVTVLTSLSEEMLRQELGLQETPEEAVRRLAKLAIDSGAHGIVCSPKEIAVLRQDLGDEPLIVTPGIRPKWSSKDDQQRVTTPNEAAKAGATHIVVGRPILKHEDPSKAVALIQDELNM